MPEGVPCREPPSAVKSSIRGLPTLTRWATEISPLRGFTLRSPRTHGEIAMLESQPQSSPSRFQSFQLQAAQVMAQRTESDAVMIVAVGAPRWSDITPAAMLEMLMVSVTRP
jgi:hypothetical protein